MSMSRYLSSVPVSRRAPRAVDRRMPSTGETIRADRYHNTRTGHNSACRACCRSTSRVKMARCTKRGPKLLRRASSSYRLRLVRSVIMRSCTVARSLEHHVLTCLGSSLLPPIAPSTLQSSTLFSIVRSKSTSIVCSHHPTTRAVQRYHASRLVPTPGHERKPCLHRDPGRQLHYLVRM